MVWSLDQDDFSNSCGNGPYPLMNVLRGRLSGITIPTQPLASSTPQSSGVVDRQSTTVGVTGLSITNAHSSTGFQTNTPLSSKQPSSTPLTSNHLATSTVAPSAGLSSCGGLCWKIDIGFFILFKFLFWSMLVLLDRSAPQSCVDGQLYGDSCDVQKYYQCASGVAHQFQCATGTVWDERIKNCNWNYLVLNSPTPCGCGRRSTSLVC